MADDGQAVARFNNGKVLKGFVRYFSNEADVIKIEEEMSGKEHFVPIDELKAIFFVKSFEGESGRRERKAFGMRENIGRKVYIRFKDGESLLGFLEGDVPWEKGFFLSRPDKLSKGFFLVPTDSDCNNDKVFVVGSSVKDITTLP